MNPSLDLPVSAVYGHGIAPELPGDAEAIDALLDAGFPGDRHARAIYRLRQGSPVPALSLVARDGDGVASSIRFWRVSLGTETLQDPALSEGVLLGPLAVAPHLQGRGYGRALVAEGLRRADAIGAAWCLVSGPADYYGPFGFRPARPLGVTPPGDLGSNAWLIRPLGEYAMPVLTEPCPVLPRRLVRSAIESGTKVVSIDMNQAA